MITLEVNGTRSEVDAPPDTPLLWVLRDQLGLTGTKYGCGIAQCGACTVHVDGEPKRSCTTTLKAVAGKQITTIEGLRSNAGQAVVAAWVKLDVVQCGYCQSGQIMSAAALLARKPKPSETEIERAMNRNLCRCVTYQRIRNAVHEASSKLGASG